MKHKRLIILVLLTLFISLSAFVIYKNTYKQEFNYVALGDSLAVGRNPYGIDDYGYVHYIKDYLDKHHKLNNYYNYGVSGYLIEDVINDIEYNRTIQIDENEMNVKRALRESNLVTISIGANDLLKNISLTEVPSIFENRDEIIKELDGVFLSLEELLLLIKKYSKGDIIVVGYYNPLPRMTKYKENIDEIVDYSNQKYQNLCNSLGIYYVNISDVFDNNVDYLPNPLDIHPNKEGYKEISDKILSIINEEILK